jgi:hypothetical protein
MDTTNTNPYTQRINLQRSKSSKTKAMPRRKKEEEKTNTIDEMQQQCTRLIKGNTSRKGTMHEHRPHRIEPTQARC